MCRYQENNEVRYMKNQCHNTKCGCHTLNYVQSHCGHYIDVTCCDKFQAEPSPPDDMEKALLLALAYMSCESCPFSKECGRAILPGLKSSDICLPIWLKHINKVKP